MTTKEALYKLLSIAIGNESDLTLPEDVSLVEVMDLSEMAGINGVVVSGLQKLVDNGFVLSADTKQRRMTRIGRSMMMEQKTAQQWNSIRRLVDLYTQNGLTTVGLKGMTVAQWYPNPMQRDSCDFDCFLLKDEDDGKLGFAFEEGNKIVEANGVHVDRNIYVHSVFAYGDVTVENHHYLSAVKLSKRHRNLDELLRELLLSEPLQPVMDTKLMTGSPMFNAVFLTHHAHRHMLNEYMPIKLLTDWALFIKNNPSLDWERFWKYADGFGMLRFAQSMTRFASNRLGTTLPFELPVDEVADELLENSIWDFPKESASGKSLFSRHLGIITNLVHARKRYKVFYDYSAFQMIAAYVKGYFFGEE